MQLSRQFEFKVVIASKHEKQIATTYYLYLCIPLVYHHAWTTTCFTSIQILASNKTDLGVVYSVRQQWRNATFLNASQIDDKVSKGKLKQDFGRSNKHRHFVTPLAFKLDHTLCYNTL